MGEEEGVRHSIDTERGKMTETKKEREKESEQEKEWKEASFIELNENHEVTWSHIVWAMVWVDINRMSPISNVSLSLALPPGLSHMRFYCWYRLYMKQTSFKARTICALWVWFLKIPKFSTKLSLNWNSGSKMENVSLWLHQTTCNIRNCLQRYSKMGKVLWA